MKEIFESALAVLGIILIVFIGILVIVFLADLLISIVDSRGGLGIFFKRKKIKQEDGLSIEKREELYNDGVENYAETQTDTNYVEAPLKNEYDEELAKKEEQELTGNVTPEETSNDETLAENEEMEYNGEEAEADHADKEAQVLEILSEYSDIFDEEEEEEKEVEEVKEEPPEEEPEFEFPDFDEPAETSGIISGQTKPELVYEPLDYTGLDKIEDWKRYIEAANKSTIEYATHAAKYNEEEDMNRLEDFIEVRKAMEDETNKMVILIEREKAEREKADKLKDAEIERLKAEVSRLNLQLAQMPVGGVDYVKEAEITRLTNENSQLRTIIENRQYDDGANAELVAELRAKIAELTESLNECVIASGGADAQTVEMINKLRIALKETEEEKEAQRKEIERIRAQIILLEQNKSDNYFITKIGAYTEEELEEQIRRKTEELRGIDREKKKVGKEYLPLFRIERTHETDLKKLRRKEALVAKQNVILYGVNNLVDMDDAKVKKLEEDQVLLDGLRASVRHCEEVLEANKDRIPLLAKSYNILDGNYKRVDTELEELRAALEELRERKTNN